MHFTSLAFRQSSGQRENFSKAICAALQINQCYENKKDTGIDFGDSALE
jgi:hypothetical protein